MWVTIHELLQFIGIQNFDGNFGPSRNNEDEFSDIPGITDILSKWYGKSEFSPTV